MILWMKRKMNNFVLFLVPQMEWSSKLFDKTLPAGFQVNKFTCILKISNCIFTWANIIPKTINIISKTTTKTRWPFSIFRKTKLVYQFTCTVTSSLVSTSTLISYTNIWRISIDKSSLKHLILNKRKYSFIWHHTMAS